jgi:hypothetical protein
MSLTAPTPLRSHIWARADFDIGEVIDPACGGGNIVKAARASHLPAEGWDVVDRGFHGTVLRDFLDSSRTIPAPCNMSQTRRSRSLKLSLSARSI